MVLDGRELVESLRTQVAEISVTQLYEICRQNSEAMVIDVREAAETNLGSIPNAVLIPRGILEMSISSEEDIKRRFSTLAMLAAQPVYLVCRSGARSILAAVSLQQMGFEDVYSVAGGFLAWQAAGYECTKQR